jgi:hypothetical protein
MSAIAMALHLIHTFPASGDVAMAMSKGHIRPFMSPAGDERHDVINRCSIPGATERTGRAGDWWNWIAAQVAAPAIALAKSTPRNRLVASGDDVPPHLLVGADVLVRAGAAPDMRPRHLPHVHAAVNAHDHGDA